MLVDQTRLHLAVQKSGRLSDSSRELLRDAGFRVQGRKNELSARIDNFPMDLMFVRDDDIPTFVSDGVCELGIVGRNVAEEFAAGQPERRFEEIAPLGFGRCDLKIAAPENVPYPGVQSLAGARIATSYPRLLGRFLVERGIEAE
ncbi:MAG: phosphoribosyltransferase, partial [Alphaproteobacteria bacterium]|nr:phosphoribosyltransferase [Alphaproteobacteria bacterium]